MTEEPRISKLKEYLMEVIDALTTDKEYEINVNMLSNEANNYSLDKIPDSIEEEVWITGDKIKKEVYSFRSRTSYSEDAINNLKNVGFFEKFEAKIESNNEKGILPNIEGIESIECANNGSMISAGTSTAEFEIDIKIKYRN